MTTLMRGTKITSVSASETTQKNFPLQKGQRVMYENEEAEIISIEPLCVIKTKDRVVCGALQRHFECG